MYYMHIISYIWKSVQQHHSSIDPIYVYIIHTSCMPARIVSYDVHCTHTAYYVYTHHTFTYMLYVRTHHVCVCTCVHVRAYDVVRTYAVRSAIIASSRTDCALLHICYMMFIYVRMSYVSSRTHTHIVHRTIIASTHIA